jgi:DNA modification methylase
MLFSKSWFIHNPPPRDEKEELHPAKFPESMIKDFIEFFTQPTAIVLDPLLGTGSTLVACEMCNRQGIGVEIEEKYAKIAQSRTRQPVLIGDAMKLDDLPILKDLKGQVDFAITSPPYWNMLNKSRGHFRSTSQIRADIGADTSYGENPRNLGNIASYEEYLDALYEVFSKVYKLLKNRKYLVVIIQNILTEDGEMKPVAWDLAKSLSSLFVLKQERIWCQDNKSLGFWGYPYRYVSSVHHHYCLVFEKMEKNESKQVS